MATSSDKRIRRKVRRSYLISTVSIALVLFILGAVSYVTLSAVNAAEALRERVIISVEIADNLSKESKREMLSAFRSREEVANVDYTSKEDKLEDEEFRRQFELDIYDILDENPLNDSFELTLHRNSVEAETIAKLTADIKAIAGVEYISEPPLETINQMHNTLSTIVLALLVFLAVLMFITLLLLNNTIRLAIYAKRYLINTMKLVGATKWYIMRPFLRSALWQGITAGITAGAMVIGLVYGAQSLMPTAIEMLDYVESAIIIGAMVVIGIVITLLFSALAVNKFVNMKTNKIHLY